MSFIPLKFHSYTDDTMVQRSREFLELMSLRRTVRDYASKPIPNGVIENALSAATTAPSGANMQPWRFVVVRDPKTKQKIRLGAEEEEREFYAHRATPEWLEALAPLGTDDNKPFLTEAPVLIAIFLERYRVDATGKRIKLYYMPESVGIACGFLITALHNAGLATLTHTPSPMGFLNKILDRPAHEKPYLLLVAGYPKENAQVPDIKRLPYSTTVIHWKKTPDPES
ncbi:MAG: nitroreductase family protein [Gammaproteobacteria bacterium]|nr:nitroreductase family protein [Gammaproteobacteria bacterium]MXX94580.1 nitroreductase family protein [Gammaproteobacteria bacterium]MYF52570.1 nitroreductase family protein [Gammaproteobacteria bacterium]MYK44269.1 nitroreductase family protein [Gammaproteobacteria bacterium]